MNRIINEFLITLRNVDAFLPSLFGRYPFPPEPLLVPITSSDLPVTAKKPFSLKDLIGDGFLYAVPIFRRTLERRKTRKIGVPYRGGPEGLKIMLKKNTIRVCETCGHYHEVSVLCPNCYAKIKAETELIQEKIQKELGLSPVDKEVVVLYDGEKSNHPVEFWNGKRIVEMEKPRPMWFSKNLLQKTTQPNSDAKEIEISSTIELKGKNLG